MKIAVTKLQEKTEGLPELFKRYGHEPVIISTMRSAEPSDIRPFLRLVDIVSKGEIEILIFTSALGVERFFEKVRPGKDIRIVSVGPKTAGKVNEYGLSSEVIKEFSSENFADHFGDIKGKKIGIARAEVPNPELISSLISKGAYVFEAAVYRLEPSGITIFPLLEEVDAIIFTSARSFEYSGFGRDDHGVTRTIAIGQKTAIAMKDRGVIPDIVGNGTLESCLDRL